MGNLVQDLYELLNVSIKLNASDLHLKVGTYPILRVDGLLQPIMDRKKITAPEMEELANTIMNDYHRNIFQEYREVDLAHAVPGLGRFRVNVFQQRGNFGMVIRVIPTKVKNIRDLFLPSVLENLALLPRGLILCTGTTGSGKTTTLASMVDHINANKKAHVITIEDPIEYIHHDRLSIINQRELGTDTTTFSRAMRAALRQDPDVILVGEMRDMSTVETALTAAETGHLVMSTLHTTDAVETVFRIISYFPPHQHRHIRLQLASVIKAVISQRLIPRADEAGRVPAAEVMVSTPLIRECIIYEEKTKYILNAMKEGVSQYGMQTFDQSLYFLVKKRAITYQEALERSSNPDEFAMKFKGIESASDISISAMEDSIESSYSYTDNQNKIIQDISGNTEDEDDDDITVDEPHPYNPGNTYEISD